MVGRAGQQGTRRTARRDSAKLAETSANTVLGSRLEFQEQEFQEQEFQKFQEQEFQEEEFQEFQEQGCQDPPLPTISYFELPSKIVANMCEYTKKSLRI